LGTILIRFTVLTEKEYFYLYIHYIDKSIGK